MKLVDAFADFWNFRGRWSRLRAPDRPWRGALLGLALGFAPIAPAEVSALEPVQDTARGLRIVAEDFWAAATSPTRMERSHWITLGQVLVVGGVLFAFDEDLDRMAQRNLDAPVVAQADELGTSLDRFGLMGKTWPWYAGTMVVGYVSGQDRLTRIGAEILEAQWMGGALRNGFKLALGRRRPNEGFGARQFEFDGGTSLPSGHAATVFATAEVLRLHLDRWWVTVPLYVAASSVGIERVTSRQHWASDAFLGAVSGIAAARLVYERHELPDSDQDQGRVWTLAPLVPPSGGAGWGLLRTF